MFEIIGNWKQNKPQQNFIDYFSRLISFQALNLNRLQIHILPPVIYLNAIRNVITANDKKGLHVGAQLVSSFSEGPYTGQISAKMLKEYEANCCLVGHSEQRLYNPCSEERLAWQCIQLQAEGILPVLCFGETQQAYESEETLSVCLQQVEGVLQAISQTGNSFKGWFAYEPVWAIGSGKHPKSTMVGKLFETLKIEFKNRFHDIESQIKVLYGGSISPSNADSFFQTKSIDGLLIGKASLDIEVLLAILSEMR